MCSARPFQSDGNWSHPLEGSWQYIASLPEHFLGSQERAQDNVPGMIVSITSLWQVLSLAFSSRVGFGAHYRAKGEGNGDTEQLA